MWHPVVQRTPMMLRSARATILSRRLLAFLPAVVGASTWLCSPAHTLAQPSCVNPPAGLISWWPGQASAADIIGGNSGAASGSTSYALGQVGQAFAFDGHPGSCIRIPYASSLASPSYTVEAWVNPLVPITDPSGQKVLFAQNAGRVQLVARPGKTGVLVLFQFFVAPNSWKTIQSATEIPLNQFSHIAATWDGTNQRLYLNGVLSAQGISAAPPWDSSCDFFVGGIYSTSGGTGCQYQGQFFQGLIDEVSYYRRTLSASEIQGIYQAGSSGKCPPTIPVISALAPGQSPPTFALDLQKRDAAGNPFITRQVFQGRQLALIVMDVWDSHPDPSMASRTSALLPRLNEALDAARALGITVIFCPNEVPLPSAADTASFAGLPNQPLGDNGFSPPLPSYSDALSGDMVPIAYDTAYYPRFPIYNRQHPDLRIRSGDLASVSRQQIANYCAAHGITCLLYVGVAANMCICWSRETSMIPMKRYCNLTPILVRDLTDSMTLNGRKQTGVNDSSDNIDLTVTPDRGHARVVAQDETSVCASIDARQLLQYWPPAAYANLITGESNLLCFWPMDSKADYQQILDMKRTQSCWWNRNDPAQTAGLNFAVTGAILGAPDTALQFSGSTVLVSPLYRDDIPSDSPLSSLSSTNFTIEAWVQPAALNSNQWFFSHDNGSSNGVDVLLGLNSNNRFQFVVGTDPSKTSFGDFLQSATLVTAEDLASNRWFQIVAVHDINSRSDSLFVNGHLDAQTNQTCVPVTLSSAPHLGSRGLAQLGGSQFLVNRGFGFFYGALDECAIYSAALSSNTVMRHYQVAQAQAPSPVTVTASAQQNQLIVTWPAWPLGWRLQTSQDLLHWQNSTLPVSEANGLRQTYVPLVGPRQFFRSASP